MKYIELNTNDICTLLAAKEPKNTRQKSSSVTKALSMTKEELDPSSIKGSYHVVKPERFLEFKYAGLNPNSGTFFPSTEYFYYCKIKNTTLEIIILLFNTLGTNCHIYKYTLELQEQDAKEAKKIIDKSPIVDVKLALLATLLVEYVNVKPTAFYEKIMRYIIKFDIKKYKKTELPLYRAITVTKKNYDALQKGEQITLKPRLGTSWSPDMKNLKKLAKLMNENTGKRSGVPILLKLKKVGSQYPVIINITSFFADPKVQEIIDIIKLPKSVKNRKLKEVLLTGNGGLDTVTKNNVVFNE